MFFSVCRNRFLWLFSLFLILSYFGYGCGGPAGPFDMLVDSTMFVGDPSPTSPLQFLINPEEQNSAGTLTAEINQEFTDRFELSISALNLSFQFADIGTINVTLDPNQPSTATVFKLNAVNRPFGLNTMTLNLVIETPDQNLVLSGVELASDTALLKLAEDLPTLGFFFQNQPKELDLSSLNVVIPAALIKSDIDTQ